MLRHLSLGIAVLVPAAAVLGFGLTRQAGERADAPADAAIEAALVRQEAPGDCGLAALATLARLRQVDVPPYASLRARHPLPAGGLTMADLVAAGASLELQLDAARVMPDGLGQIPLPAIVHLRAGHYVVLAARGSAEWIVADPAQGVRRFPPFVFASHASGAVLLVRERKESS